MNTSRLSSIPFSPIQTMKELEIVEGIDNDRSVASTTTHESIQTPLQIAKHSKKLSPAAIVKEGEEVHLMQQSLSLSSSTSPENNARRCHHHKLRKDQFTRFQQNRYSSSTLSTSKVLASDNNVNVNDCNCHSPSSKLSAFRIRLMTPIAHSNSSEENHDSTSQAGSSIDTVSELRRFVSNDIETHPSDERDDHDELADVEDELNLNNRSDGDNLNQVIIRVEDDSEIEGLDEEEIETQVEEVRDETEEERIRREEEESEALARQLMAEEAMASYAQSSNFLREHANEYSEEDLRALEALMAEEDPMNDQGGDEFDDDAEEPDELSYEALLQLGERIGDVKTERWTLKAKLEINKLKTVKFTHDLAEGKDENDCCVKCLVCQFQYEEGETIRVLPCKHRFHDECVYQWLLTKDHCPYCRQSITEE